MLRSIARRRVLAIPRFSSRRVLAIPRFSSRRDFSSSDSKPPGHQDEPLNEGSTQEEVGTPSDMNKTEIKTEITEEDKKRKPQMSFFSEPEEFDPDDIKPFAFDDIPSDHHDIIEHGRELRRFMRKTKFEFPQLQQLWKPFVPPSEEECIQIRTMHYQGEEHPASRKAVANIHVPTLAKIQNLSEEQVHKLVLLAGPRYTRDYIKISCEDFPYVQQNIKWISDTLNKLINAAKEGGDWGDLPLPKQKPSKKTFPFPKEWLRPQTTT